MSSTNTNTVALLTRILANSWSTATAHIPETHRNKRALEKTKMGIAFGILFAKMALIPQNPTVRQLRYPAGIIAQSRTLNPLALGPTN